MAVYVDNVRIKWANNEWCHLVADSIDELHEFANSLGLKRKWFQISASYPHYDVTVANRTKALSLGAQAGTRKQIITCAKKLKKEYFLNKTREIPIQLKLFP